MAFKYVVAFCVALAVCVSGQQQSSCVESYCHGITPESSKLECCTKSAWDSLVAINNKYHNIDPMYIESMVLYYYFLPTTFKYNTIKGSMDMKTRVVSCNDSVWITKFYIPVLTADSYVEKYALLGGNVTTRLEGVSGRMEFHKDLNSHPTQLSEIRITLDIERMVAHSPHFLLDVVVSTIVNVLGGSRSNEGTEKSAAEFMQSYLLKALNQAYRDDNCPGP